MKKNNSGRLFVLWLLIEVLLVGADAGLFFLGANGQEVMASCMITVFFSVIGIYVIRVFYRDCIKPGRTLEKSGDSTMEIRRAKVNKRRKGKNMYEIVDNYRRQYFQTMIIVIFIMAYLLSAAFVIKMNEYDLGVRIPFWVSILIALAIVAVSVVLTYKADFAFMSGKDLKREILRQGLDEMQVDNDFMMATYHDMFKGMMAIGQSYYVVFMQKFCHVGRIRAITAIEAYSETYKMERTKFKRYFIRIHESDHTVSYFMCADSIASELIMREFQNLGLEVKNEDHPDS